MSVHLLPVEGLPEVRPGDDLAEMLSPRLRELGIRHGDVVVVTQKVVSKAEGRVVPEGEGRAAWVERETRRVVARRGDLVIAETAHGFVCANAGVDASNVEAGFLTLLPADPDASAARLRSAFAATLGVEVGVVVTDTFGRPWRRGLVNVAIGCAGLPALVDLRGSADHGGRELEATVVALADEVAAASGLVMGKSAGVPVAIVRGAPRGGAPTPAAELVRPVEEDLFRESPLQSLSARRTARAFGGGEVPAERIEESVRAAFAAATPGRPRPFCFAALRSAAARRRLVAAVGGGEGRDVLSSAPALVVPWVRFDEVPRHEDPERTHAEQEALLVSAGAAVQNLLLALHAQGLASGWTDAALFDQAAAREAVGMEDRWFALGVVALGPAPAGAAGAAPSRPPIDLEQVLRVR